MDADFEAVQVLSAGSGRREIYHAGRFSILEIIGVMGVDDLLNWILCSISCQEVLI